ncbi:MAG: glycosyltransferase family 4 protein, partial [Verrucomicrobia bacterium]|nr:glycosyltransferase family 4 protein [Verrucomicrobiota bacterium]
NVQLLGRKNSSEVARFMRAADVLVVPSENEGVPNVVLEAFACRLRVAATRVGGIPEVLTGDFLGRLVPQDDVSAMASAIAEILTAPLQTEAVDAHAAKFSWDETAKAYLALLERA